MDVYFINLDRRADRRARMEERFAALQLKAKRITAIEPADLNEEQRHMCRRSWKTHFPIIEIELCCNLSHKRALEALIASDAPYATIFEDDAELADDLGELFAALDQDGLRCDVLRLETYLENSHYSDKAVGQIGRYALHAMPHYHWGAAGYVIGRRAAKLLLETPKFWEITFDTVLWRLFPDKTQVSTLQLVPAPLAQFDRLNQVGVGSDLAIFRQPAYVTINREMPVLARLQIFYRYEIVAGLAVHFQRLLKRVRRDVIPFSGKLLD